MGEAAPRQSESRKRGGGFVPQPRTLARRLADEGTIYGEVVDQLRSSLATQYLNDPGMSLGQIVAARIRGIDLMTHAFSATGIYRLPLIGTGARTPLA